MTEDPARVAARKRIEARRAFKTTAASFAVVWVVLIAIWALTSPDEFFWPIFPIGGMAIALFFQGMGLRTRNPISEDEIDREMQRG